MKPTSQMIDEAWKQIGAGQARLSKNQVKLVFQELLRLQINHADEESKKMKDELAKQQVSMERMCRNQRLEVMQEEDRGNISQDQLDRAHALVMGNDAGPVMAGMMCGYMDVPVKSLMAMRDGQDLLNLRADLLFKGKDVDGCITQEE